MRASLQRLFLGLNMKEQPLCRPVHYCLLKPTWQSRIHEDYGYFYLRFKMSHFRYLIHVISTIGHITNSQWPALQLA